MKHRRSHRQKHKKLSLRRKSYGGNIYPLDTYLMSLDNEEGLIKTTNGYIFRTRVRKELIDRVKMDKYETDITRKKLFDQTTPFSELVEDDGWEDFDNESRRAPYSLKPKTLHALLVDMRIPYFSGLSVGDIAEIMDRFNTCHHLRYNIDKSYTVSEHKDVCKMTILIYRKKDPSISDTTIIDGVTIDPPGWIDSDTHYGAIAFIGNQHNNEGLYHKVYINGDGGRELVSIFYTNFGHEIDSYIKPRVERQSSSSDSDQAGGVDQSSYTLPNLANKSSPSPTNAPIQTNTQQQPVTLPQILAALQQLFPQIQEEIQALQNQINNNTHI